MSNRAKAETINHSMTMEQHTAMMILARYRHNLHCCENIITGEEREVKIFTEVIPRMMQTVRLPTFSVLIPTSGESGVSGKYGKRRIVEEVNNEIEDYMRLIDRIYGTTYSPSGYLRQAYAERNGLNSNLVPA